MPSAQFNFNTGLKAKRSVFATKPDGIGMPDPGMAPRSAPQQPPARQVAPTGGKLSAFGGGIKPPMPLKEKEAVVLKLKNQNGAIPSK